MVISSINFNPIPPIFEIVKLVAIISFISIDLGISGLSLKCSIPRSISNPLIVMLYSVKDLAFD